MTHTDPIKALVDLGPELQKRYDSRSVMNPTGSILLTYEEAPTILAAIEALTPIAARIEALEEALKDAQGVLMTRNQQIEELRDRLALRILSTRHS